MKLPIRSMICAPKGYYLLSCDLSQAEAWVVAYECADQRMKEALLYGKQELQNDIHCLTGRVVNDIPEGGTITKEQRYLGKKCNHAFNYRMGGERAAEVINSEGQVTVTVKQAKAFHAKYHEFYNLKLWWAELEEQLNIDRTITTIYNRQRTFFNQWGNELFKEATAFKPQSTIADHMFGAIQEEVGIEGGILGVYNKIVKGQNEIRLVNTSHDSLILEVPKGIINEIGEQVVSLLRRPMIIKGESFTVPVDADYSERWGEQGEVIKC